MLNAIKHIHAIRSGTAQVGDTDSYQVAERTGIEPDFWSIINAKFPPHMPWNRLKPVERGSIIKAAKILDNNDIPYYIYADFLKAFGKGHLIHRTPLTVTAFKDKKTGARPMLSDFIQLINVLVTAYDQDPNTIYVLESAYKVYSGYDHGLLTMAYATTEIQKYIKKSGVRDTMAVLGNCKTLPEFIESLGQTRAKKESWENRGTQSSTAKFLVMELRIRRGTVSGIPNPKFDKYFTKSNALNAKGIKLVTKGS